MSGAPNIALLHRPHAEIILVTPDMARALLARNKSNRKFRKYHADRIARLIAGNRWRFNGETIKIDYEGNPQDGQHRLHAIIIANQACLSVVVYGVERSAFSTIDTMRLPRSFGDVVQLSQNSTAKTTKYYALVGTALAWLCRWDRGLFDSGFPELRTPESKVENDEIERKFESDPDILATVERAYEVRAIIPVSLFGFFLYVLKRQGNVKLADRLFAAMVDASTLPIDDPYLLLRRWLQAGDKKRRESIHILAMMIKATNYVARGQSIKTLLWHYQSKRPEPFPKLELQ